MKRNVYLHGILADKYGAGPHVLDADTPALITRGLCSTLPGIKQDIRENNFYFARGEDHWDNYLTQDAIVNGFELGGVDECHLIPAIEGSDRSGIKLVVGVVVLAVATAGAAGLLGGTAAAGGGLAFGAEAGIGLGITWGNIALVGAGLALQGISGLLAPTPELGEATNAESAEERPSFIFNGPVNVQEQGGPVPLTFGRVKTGSVVVSSGIRVEQIEALN